MGKKLILTGFSIYDTKCRVMAVLDETGVLELQVHPLEDDTILGNIYIGKVNKVMPEIKGAFIDIKPNFPCYLSLDECETRGLKAGDELLVQVEQEALKSKVPKVTVNLNLAGKFMVVTLGRKELGISSRLDRDVRRSLKKWMEPYKREDCGIIMRTNAAGASEEEILKELSELYQRLDTVLLKGRTRTCYSLVEQAVPYYIQELKNLKDGELEKFITDIPEIYESINSYLTEYQPGSSRMLQFYEDRLLPLHKLFSLEREVSNALRQKIWLRSGGFLVIQQTEAFVAIDVNSGKYSGKKKASETYRKINLEAAREIARQLRIRNLYGIILVDFINMDNPDHQDELLHVLSACCKKDPVKTNVIDMTRLQIVEITRKKTRKSLHEQISTLRGAKEGDV
ncbi:ribonuclease E/G [Ruminococcus sp. OA3]|uniref:ribonuclease E/G n=1 Tax=Ruminococcus sp. OA3 TaxID=2914164 RepID=UPI001F068C8A|nr:ribonuclease E/G [Ruminococcus sp. OA3]MCH1983523.1 ribonuclease E/G [Ruminococcus sp. OA3]